MQTWVSWNRHRHQLTLRQRHRVIGYADAVVLEDVQFVVQAGGQRRCRAQGQRNVHAFVVGRQADASLPDASAVMVGYNPYHNDTFVTTDGMPVAGAAKVWVTDPGPGHNGRCAMRRRRVGLVLAALFGVLLTRLVLAQAPLVHVTAFGTPGLPPDTFYVNVVAYGAGALVITGEPALPEPETVTDGTCARTELQVSCQVAAGASVLFRVTDQQWVKGGLDGTSHRLPINQPPPTATVTTTPTNTLTPTPDTRVFDPRAYLAVTLNDSAVSSAVLDPTATPGAVLPPPPAPSPEATPSAAPTQTATPEPGYAPQRLLPVVVREATFHE